MSDTVINVVNRALGRLRISPLTDDEFNSGIEGIHLATRNEFRRAYQFLADLKKEEFKTFEDVTTTAGVNEYSTSFDTNRFADVSSSAYLIDLAGDDDQQLIYYSEKTVLYQYQGDLSEIPEGRPYGYFFRTTPTSNIIRFSLLDVPDDVYTIRLYYYVPAVTLVAADPTVCSPQGDDFLEDHMYAFTGYQKGLMSLDEATLLQRQAKRRYVCQNFNVNTRYSYQAPFQHGTVNSGIAYTRTGRAFV